MNKRYLLILNEGNFDRNTLNEFIQELLGVGITIENGDAYTLYIFNDQPDLLLEDSLKALVYDMSYDLKAYVSNCISLDDIKANIKLVLSLFPKALKASVYNEKMLVEELLNSNAASLKVLALKDYLYDNEMQNILLVFMKNNLNTLQTAKSLYMHRNTLINKLDRFYNVTGYDVRNFLDAYIIYSLIK